MFSTYLADEYRSLRAALIATINDELRIERDIAALRGELDENKRVYRALERRFLTVIREGR